MVVGLVYRGRLGDCIIIEKGGEVYQNGLD